MCSSHLIRHNVEPLLDKLITGDGNWILYENIRRKKSYYKPGTSSATVPKPSIHQLKVLLCLWWGMKGYQRKEAREGIVFHHENAPTHTAMVTQQKLNALGWKVLGHPP
ncbi:mariner Mos1 transposase [Trichonephila clavipes]|nr:mariner Mos1 transposase [Trichonephila clavipes]